mgnify:CR=1 FL=1
MAYLNKLFWPKLPKFLIFSINSVHYWGSVNYPIIRRELISLFIVGWLLRAWRRFRLWVTLLRHVRIDVCCHRFSVCPSPDDAPLGFFRCPTVQVTGAHLSVSGGHGWFESHLGDDPDWLCCCVLWVTDRGTPVGWNVFPFRAKHGRFVF